MTKTSGNLALNTGATMKTFDVRRSAGPVKRKEPVLKPKRVSVSATPRREVVQQAQVKAIRQQLAFQRLRMLLGAILTIFVIAGAFAFVVYRQATILEMNFKNLAIERQISRLDQERGQISEELAQKTNLDLIRQQAMDKLGLQDPAGSQLVQVVIPQSDRIIFAQPSAGTSENEAFLASVYRTVEGYFKSLNQQGKVK